MKSMAYNPHMILLIGKHGMLSRAIQDQLQDENLIIVDSDLARKWSKQNSTFEILEFMKSLQNLPKLIINSAGQTNPNSHPDLLLGANFYLPKNLFQFAETVGIKLITFGTIFESIEELGTSNEYLKSKYKFYEYIQDKANIQSQMLHIQAHTWYGGHSLHDHMFLGQAFNAIRRGITFEMTSGKQLREFHHIEDDMNAFELLLNQNISGIFQLNHGFPVTLQTLAEGLFDHFGLSEKLKLGYLPTPNVENSKITFEASRLLSDVRFRDAIPGVSSYFRLLLNEVQ